MVGLLVSSAGAVNRAIHSTSFPDPRQQPLGVNLSGTDVHQHRSGGGQPQSPSIKVTVASPDRLSIALDHAWATPEGSVAAATYSRGVDVGFITGCAPGSAAAPPSATYHAGCSSR